MEDCHREERAERGTRQSIVSWGTRTGLSVRVVRASGSPRPQGARDDKSGIFTMKGVKRLEFTLCHCEEGTQVTDAAIHRVSEDAGGFVCSGTEDQWIATPARGSR